MSAESPKRNQTSGGGGGGGNGSSNRSVPTVVPPQAVSDRSIIESVAGFINEVALTTSNSQIDPKEQILWTRFETDADISDLSFGEDWDLEDGCAPPLILTLGYGTGIQMWAIPANGEAIEILTWRHGGPVKCLKILPTPLLDYSDQTSPVTDLFSQKRPLMAICDSSTMVNFVSLRDGDTVKSIKFKHPIVEILATRTTVVVTFQERIAVFDARTFEDRCTMTKCFPSPGLNPNPVALGSRWMAYAELKLMPSKRSNGGYDGFGGTSKITSVINAAKSLGKGLKGIGETIGLTGQVANHSGGQTTYAGAGGEQNSGSLSPSSSSGTVNVDGRQAGIVTITDIKYPIKEISPTTGTPVTVKGNDPVVAHFIAHTDPIVNLAFDPSGMLLLTADKRGHDFHLFRVYPHPGGPSLASVHHLYVLHRGDTTAKVQDIAFAMDSRWVAVSSLRGTTHVFPITPYGGAVGIRTHGSPHVVNQLSRFHRSAGLSVDGRSSSPITYADNQSGSAHHNHGSNQNGLYPGSNSNTFANPRTPPFPHPTTILPLTQLRQPYSLSVPTSSNPQTPQVKDYLFNVTLGRQRHSSLSDDSMMGSGSSTPPNPLRVCATFARPRAWLLEPPGITRDTPSARLNRSVMDSLFIMASHGSLIQYDLEPKHLSNIAREKVCDDTPIELFVEPKAQWNLLRNELKLTEIEPPLPVDNWLLKDRLSNMTRDDKMDDFNDKDDRWLSQVEIITHAGPHRRLWMGPQFIFKTYNTPSGAPLHHIDMEAVEIGLNGSGNPGTRSNPVNMPVSNNERPIVPVLIESGSYSSYEQSPRLSDQFRVFEENDEFSLEPRESQLREDLADAMRDLPSANPTGFTVHIKETGGPSISPSSSTSSSLAANNSSSRQLQNQQQQQPPESDDTLEHSPQSPLKRGKVIHTSIENIVNPLGTVTKVIKVNDPLFDSMNSDSSLGRFSNNDQYIHENCDEALFRPVVTVVEKKINSEEEYPSKNEPPVKPTIVSRNLIVPVEIDTGVKTVNEPTKKTKEKSPEVGTLKMDESLSVAEIRPSSKAKQNKNKRNKNDEKEKSVEKQIVEPVVDSKKGQTSNMNKKASTKKLKKNIENNESEYVVVIESDNKQSEPGSTPELNTGGGSIEVETSFTVQVPRKSNVKEEINNSEDISSFNIISKQQDFDFIQDSLMKDTVVTSGAKSKNKSASNSEVKLFSESDPVVQKRSTFFDISDTKIELELSDDCVQEEDMYTDPLVPLEPFDPSSFENLEFSKAEDQCLMTFESPSFDDEVMMVADSEKTAKVQPWNENNLIFALCTSLQGDDEAVEDNSDLIVTEPGLELEIDENYMELDRGKKKEPQKDKLELNANLTVSTGSSEEEASTQSSSDSTNSNTGTSGRQTNTDEGEGDDFNRKENRKQKSSLDEDDEELRPLLKNSEESNKKEKTPDPKEPSPNTANSTKQLQQQPQSKKKSHHVDGGDQPQPIRGKCLLTGTASLDSGAAAVLAEELSSSSFSSSPTASYNGENLLHFHGDSSGSL